MGLENEKKKEDTTSVSLSGIDFHNEKVKRFVLTVSRNLLAVVYQQELSER